MAMVNVIRILNRDKAIAALAKMRQEWQEASGGVPLSDVSAPVGLLLADVVSALELLPEEAEQILDGEGFTEPAPFALPAYADIE